MKALSFICFLTPIRPFATGVRKVCLMAAPLIASVSLAAGSAVPVAVNSRVSDDYVRGRQADGSFAPEYYAFGEGGCWGGDQRDESIDKLKFRDVARTIAGPLAGQKYLPTRSTGETKFLIMVYWGTTAGSLGSPASQSYRNLQASQISSATSAASVPGAWGNSLTTAALPSSVHNGNGAGAESQASSRPPDGVLDMILAAELTRTYIDSENAKKLGYTDEILRYEPLRGTAAQIRRDDLYEEVGHNRYFVVLEAYDFQLLRTQKKHKLVWEARYSIDEGGNDFSEKLAAMTQAAARYFGQSSNGLQRRSLPETNVRFGEFKVLDYMPEK
ncbi:MAG TPA: hypothetical protein VGM64_10770 [Lacunisphaera sp.]